MPGVSETRTYDVVLTTTLANYRKQLIDNVFDTYPFLSYLNGKLGNAVRGASVKRTIDGGESIVEHILYGMNSTVKSYSGYELLDTTPQEGMTIARYSWKQYSGTISISGLEERTNKGDARMINLLESKIKQTEMTLRDQLSQGGFSDGTGNGGKNLTGLSAIVSSSGTLGGISATTYPWWAAVAATSSSFAANGISTMRTMFNNLSYGNDKPDAIFTTQTIYEYYEGVLQPQERFTNTQAADAGFVNLTFKGIPIYFDRDCTSGIMYFLNSNYLNLVVHSDADFATGAFIDAIDQDGKSAKILFQGNLTTNNRRMHGAVTVSAA
jgi:hypothetical protein